MLRQKTHEPDTFRCGGGGGALILSPPDLRHSLAPTSGHVWLGSQCDPLIPDPAHDRKFSAFWMNKMSALMLERGAAAAENNIKNKLGKKKKEEKWKDFVGI